MRRLRRTPLIRDLIREVSVTRSDLIQPIFIDENLSSDAPIPSMPGQKRLALSSLHTELQRLLDRGIKSTILFGIPRIKDAKGLGASDSRGIIQQAIDEIRDSFGDQIVVLTDVCMCEYTDHGHCGIVRDGIIDNDESLKRLAEIAVSHATAG